MTFSALRGPLFLSAAFLISSCTEDALPEPSETDCITDATPVFVGDIQPIIERSCAYSGCHLGGAPGVYDSYEGLLPDLESGRFAQRVIELRADPNVGMPPNYSPPDRPEDLTDEELQLISCWLQAGFPQE